MPVENLIPLLYSSTPNTKPLVGTRLTGELWMNFADNQLGLIDAGQAAQPLLAVRFFSTLTAYSSGDCVVQGGKLYVAKAAVPAGPFVSAQWAAYQSAVDNAALYLALAGGTLTGPLLLAADPSAALGAATKQYVDTKAGLYLPLAGGTLTGNIVVSTATWPSLSLKAATAGSGRQLLGYTGNNLRWEMDLGDSLAESGSNAGSNFAISAYNDAGVSLGTPLTVHRASAYAYVNGNGATPAPLVAGPYGHASIGLNKAGSGVQSQLTSYNNGVLRWQMVVGDASAESGSNAGSNFQLNSWSDAGGLIGTPLTINRATGAATFSASITASAGIFVPNPGQITLRGSAQPAVFFQNNTGTLMGQCYWQPSGNTVGLYNGIGATSTAALNASGQWQTNTHYNATATAYMAGGTLWQNTSDARIKNVVGEYTLGLNEVLQLRPIRYTFKGNDTWTDDLAAHPLGSDGKELEPVLSKTGAAPYPGSHHHDYAKEGREFVGFIAQEVETILPGAVSKRKGYIDGQEVSDMRDLNLHELLFALVNSVKSLKAEIDELKGAQGKAG